MSGERRQIFGLAHDPFPRTVETIASVAVNLVRRPSRLDHLLSAGLSGPGPILHALNAGSSPPQRTRPIYMKRLAFYQPGRGTGVSTCHQTSTVLCVHHPSSQSHHRAPIRPPSTAPRPGSRHAPDSATAQSPACAPTPQSSPVAHVCPDPPCGA